MDVIERNKTMPVQKSYYFTVTKLRLAFMKDLFCASADHFMLEFVINK